MQIKKHSKITLHTCQDGDYMFFKKTINVVENVEKLELLYGVGGHAKWCSCHEKTVWRFLKILEMILPYDPAIALLGIYLKEFNSLGGICTPLFTAALFTKPKIWKPLICPPTDE